MSLSSALSVGRTALATYQAALQVVGNNIANAGTPGYSRLSPDLSPIPGVSFGGGQLGLGVQLDSVRRNVSEALMARLRSSSSDREMADIERNALSRLEAVFDPLSESGIGTLMSRFFNTMGELQNNPENLAARGLVLSSASLLSEQMRQTRTQLINLRDDWNREISLTVNHADQIATQIADLNTQIVSAEAGSNGEAGALRDQRDNLLGELSELFNLTVREQPSGAVSVYIGNESLIQFGESRGLKVSLEIDDEGLQLAVVRFKDDNGQVNPYSGKVKGLIESRDRHTGGLMSRLDSLAATLINEVNKIHSGGQGLIGQSSTNSVYAAIDPSQALSDADNGLTFLAQTGSFFIDVTNSVTGATTRHQVNIDLDGIGADSTLNSVAADIAANTPVTATVLADGRLQLSAPAGSTLTFADDTSGFLASIGLNVFFTGETSADIDVSALLEGDPRLLAAAQNRLSGDGTNATAIVQLANTVVASLGGLSLNEHYTLTVSGIAVDSSAAQTKLDAASTIFDSLTVQRESISGVSLDEEAVSMMTYQRAFEGAARYMTVVNDMLQTLLGILR